VQRILERFKSVEPVVQQIMIPLDRQTLKTYRIYWLDGFEGYRSGDAKG
jgi:hypothetical protein